MRECVPDCNEEEKLNAFEGLLGGFPPEYTPAEADSGKLKVLTQLLGTIREHSPSER